MNVLFVTPWYPSPDDPVRGTFVREHARAAALRHDVRVLHHLGVEGHSGSSWWSVRVDDNGGPPVYRVSVRAPALPKTAYVRAVHAALHATAHIADDGFRPDLVHANTFPAGPVAAVLAARYRVPYVLSEHLSALPRGRLDRLERLQARIAYARARMVLPVSSYLGDAVTALSGRSYRVVDNAVDTDLFFPAEDESAGPPTRLLFVGNLLPVKGLDLLFTTLGRPEVRRLAWSLDVVGDGPLRAQCETWADESGVAERTTFHGAVAKRDVAAAMRRSDILLLTSQTEMQSCVSIEAMASGVPVVAPAVGALPEVVTVDDGVLVENRTASDLAAALCDVLEGRTTFDRAKIADRARRRFSLDAVGRELDAVYREVR